MAWICNPHPVYPNFFSLLVGKTAQARKTTAYEFALKLLQEATGRIRESKIKQLYGIASIEGLAAAMSDGDGGFRVLCVEDEFRSLITKSGSGNIIPRLTELYNCPQTFQINTRKNALAVAEPFVCLLSATTQAWFEDSLSVKDAIGGFLNRWLLFGGEASKVLPFPPEVAKPAWDELIIELSVAVNSARGGYELSEAAKLIYSDFYTALRSAPPSPATARMDLHAKKLGLLYAVLAQHAQIEVDDISAGIAVAKYCAATAEPLALRLDSCPRKRKEERLLAALRTGPMSAREVYRKLHISAAELVGLAGSLSEVGQITRVGDRYAVTE
ncbi:MAG TPA: hypothetical protein VGN17_01000 [Bryobacteraceae bacterium]|jgi:hypothetical protein